MHGLLGWISLDPMPQGSGTGGNCEDTGSELLCAVFGIGYLILQLVIPLLIALFAFKSYKHLIFRVLTIVFDWTVFLVFHFLLKGLLRARYRIKHFFTDVREHIEEYVPWRFCTCALLLAWGTVIADAVEGVCRYWSQVHLRRHHTKYGHYRRMAPPEYERNSVEE